jgi:hypothetical protein
MNGMNGAPNRAWPANDATLDALNALQRSGNATTVNMYYLRDIIDGNGNHPNGSTGAPAQFGGNIPRNDGINMADAAVNNTFAHELGHMILNGGAQHLELPTDAAHSGDRTNLMWPDGTQTAQSFAQVGMIGRHDIVTSSQALRVMGNLGNNNPGLVGRNAIDTTYANRVDWDFVTDSGQTSFTHNNTFDGRQVTVTGGAETVGNNVDEQNPPGVDSLFFGINPNMPGHADPATHDHTGLGAFPATPNFGGNSFRMVDVFSLTLRYGDYDQGNTGGQSLKDGALDYDVFFRALDGSIVPGAPIVAFMPGWSALTNADNYLCRWQSPVDANGVFVFAHNGDGHDYNCQIDAVIAAVPEPTAMGVIAIGSSIAAMVRRRRRAA